MGAHVRTGVNIGQAWVSCIFTLTCLVLLCVKTKQKIKILLKTSDFWNLVKKSAICALFGRVSNRGTVSCCRQEQTSQESSGLPRRPEPGAAASCAGELGLSAKLCQHLLLTFCTWSPPNQPASYIWQRCRQSQQAVTSELHM